jgi:hypothetical protein
MSSPAVSGARARRPEPALHARPAPAHRPLLPRGLPVGGLRVDLSSGKSEWSDQVYEIHGFVPGEIVPSVDVMLAHVHPEDRGRVTGLLTDLRTAGRGVLGSMHRILDAQGGDRVVSLTGQVREREGSPAELVGYLLDVTRPQREIADQRATSAIAAAAASRASIEQAKGILMALRQVDADEAFATLRRRSNDLNVPLRAVAGTLVERVQGLAPAGTVTGHEHQPEVSRVGVSVDRVVDDVVGPPR